MADIPGTRRVGAIDAEGRGTVIEEPVPRPKPGQVLVRVRASLISPGTELNVARQRRLAVAKGEPGQAQVWPFGYQNAGDVIAVGRGRCRWKEGDRVACMGGGYALHTDYAVVPQNLCVGLPDGVSYEDGAYNHLIATAMHAVRRGQIELGEYALVAGMGLVGQLTAQILQLAGAWTMAWDTVPGRLRRAQRCGIHGVSRIGTDDAAAIASEFTAGHGFDMAVIAFGGNATQPLREIARVMKTTLDGHNWGRVVLVGGAVFEAQGGAGLGNLDIRSSARTGAGYHDDDWEHGRTDYPPVFMRWTTQSNLQFIMRLLAAGRLRIKPLTTHRLPLDQIDKAIDLHLDHPDKTLGTVLEMTP